MRSRITRAGASQAAAIALGLAVAAVFGAGSAQAGTLPAAQAGSRTVAVSSTESSAYADSSRQSGAQTMVSAIDLGGPVGILAVTGGMGGLVVGLVRRRRKAVARAGAEAER